MRNEATEVEPDHIRLFRLSDLFFKGRDMVTLVFLKD